MISFCLITGAACFLYFIVLLLYSGFHNMFYLTWPLMGISFFGLSLFFRLGLQNRIPHLLKILLLIGIVISILIFVAVEGMILKGCYTQPARQADYVIVLGAHVRPEGVSRTLAFRLDRALSYIEEYPDTVFIVTGGKGANEPCTEAAAMQHYLIQHGMDSAHILIEDKASDTRENILFSKELIPENASVGIITNGFHMTRALHLASVLGLIDPIGIPAGNDLPTQPTNLLREFFAVVKDYVLVPLGLLKTF